MEEGDGGEKKAGQGEGKGDGKTQGSGRIFHILVFTLYTFSCQKNKEWRLRREARVNEAECENDSVSSGNEDLERALRLIFHTPNIFISDTRFMNTNVSMSVCPCL